MKLFVYCQENDLTKSQLERLKTKYEQVSLINSADFSEIKTDKSDKVIALDPDVIDWNFPNDLIDQIPNLKALCLETTGYEWVDGDYCRKKSIAVTNVPHYAGQAVAEKALFMALALAKKFPLFQREGKMNYAPQFIGENMKDKPTDIIGLGDIGLKLATMLDSIIGVKEICYYSRNKNDKYHYMEFNDMLTQSEYMFVTISKNPESLALFDDLSKFNKNMKVIITANGFEEVAERLAEKCEAGELGGVAFESDNLDRSFKSNVFVTPHNAYYTREALVDMFEIWTNTILVAGDKPINIVNGVNY